MDSIRVVGAREHNLKGVDLAIPRDSLVVFTGLSGSGKSSLAFDTIHQEGQRRFLESLSAYARQFLGTLEKPKVDRVDGLSPTLCIDQKTVNRNPRSTVGTITEILDHLRLLLARLGTPRCPVCHTVIQTLSPGQIADLLLRESPGAALIVLAPIVRDRKGEYRKELAQALRDGWLRARIDGELRSLEEEITLARYEKHTIELVVDRLRAHPAQRDRLVEALERGLSLGEGVVTCLVDDQHRAFSSARTCVEHGVSIPEMEPRLFSFNAPQGMCPTCSGLGYLEDFDQELLFDPRAPVGEALRALEGDDPLPFTTLSRDVLREVAEAIGVTPDTRWGALSDEHRRVMLEGSDLRYEVTRVSGGRTTTLEKRWGGIMPTLEQVWKYTWLQRLGRYRRQVVCPSCAGKRLNPVALAVDFRGQSISTLAHMSVTDARRFFDELKLEGDELSVGEPILREIRGRLVFLDQVGLGYLSLDRSAATLSGGEGQRIRLASAVGAGLQGITYILDEPSIGLHTRDHARLLDALLRLRDKGNTVIVVEHDPETMARADWLVEVGPGAGRLGGTLVASAPPGEFLRSGAVTARWLRGEERIPVPERRRPGNGASLRLRGARANNLNGVDVEIPLGCLIAVTGVSGSGKSSLILDVLHRALCKALGHEHDRPGEHDGLEGAENLDKVIEIDQAPIGRTPRSNPATYTGAMDLIRDLFAELPESRARGYKKGRFSFNVEGGRCEECQGAGVKTVEMQFLADVDVVCESCAGRRFNPDTLAVRYRGKTITDVLEMTISEATSFFAAHRKLHRILSTLDQTGLGYVALGQPSTTLSGGEAQRIKLATELQRPATGRTLYILDEPTTGLHMADIARLLGALNALVEAGNTVLVIEHNTDIIKVADHLIDLGPEGGAGGGRLVGQGTPERVAALDTPTGRALAEVLRREGRLSHDVTSVNRLEEPGFVYAAPRPRGQGTDLVLRGVHTHNLQGLDVALPAGKMSVITGVSGSGKTSLAFDTLFSEGQRRYVESLSTYARRFLGRMERAPVDHVEGLAPAIAIDQQNRGHNPRSTVATVTEIYDAFRLLYARIGHAHCPTCHQPLRALSPTAAARRLQGLAPGAGWLLADLPAGQRAGELLREGWTRVMIDGGEQELSDPEALLPAVGLVIDRLDPASAPPERLSEAVATAYGWGQDRARFLPRKGGAEIVLTRAAVCPEHGRALPLELTPRHFSFNALLGACPACAGLGRRLSIDLDLLFPYPGHALEGAIDGRVGAVLLRNPRSEALIRALYRRYNTPYDTAFRALPAELKRDLLRGVAEPIAISFERSWGKTKAKIEETQTWVGILPLVEGWAASTEWVRREATCPDCHGQRLKPELLAVTLGATATAPLEKGRRPGLSIAEVSAMTVVQARRFWAEIPLSADERTIAEQVLDELGARLGFLDDVGLGYLTLDRPAETLSGGEAQRIRLATQLGAKLTGVLYVLDEPTTGLHQRDTARLLATLRGLSDLGNTLVVVEHDPEVMRAADHLLDLGPGAGEHGGRLIDQGTPAAVAAGPGLTGEYLSGRRVIPTPAQRRTPKGWLTAQPSSLHNLKGVTPRFPLGCLSVVTGVSGSGKSTLALDVFAPWYVSQPGARLVTVDQRPIGRTPRSTPASYCGIWDPVRALFAQSEASRQRGWGPGRYTFNSPDGGRCVHCEGRGSIQVEMHFLSDVWIRCDRCRGRRFDGETLEVRWRGLSIADVLDLTADDALDVFKNQRAIKKRLQAMVDVGLGYLRLGQPAPTLSGGEAQRLKLAEELMGRPQPTVYLLDEPTTGLHFADVDKLLGVLHRLVEAGHTVIIIEHHLDVIRNADHVVDMGPEGGDAGGRIVAEGTPEQIVAAGTWTGRALGATGLSPAPGLKAPPPAPAAPAAGGRARPSPPRRKKG